jgi:hypothetical protein
MARSAAEKTFRGNGNLPDFNQQSSGPEVMNVNIRPTRGLGSYGRQTVGNSPRKPRSGERGYGLGERSLMNSPNSLLRKG